MKSTLFLFRSSGSPGDILREQSRQLHWREPRAPQRQPRRSEERSSAAPLATPVPRPPTRCRCPCPSAASGSCQVPVSSAPSLRTHRSHNKSPKIPTVSAPSLPMLAHRSVTPPARGSCLQGPRRSAGLAPSQETGMGKPRKSAQNTKV